MRFCHGAKADARRLPFPDDGEQESRHEEHERQPTG